MHLTVQALFAGLRLPMTVRRGTILNPTPRQLADCLMLVFVTGGWGILRHPSGELLLEAGCIVAVPERLWWSLLPQGFTETVSLYVHDDFLDDQLRWLPLMHPLVHLTLAARAGLDAPGVIHVGEPGMRRLWPILSALADLDHTSANEFATLGRVANLFEELLTLDTHTDPSSGAPAPRVRLPRRQIAAAASALRNEMQRPWTVRLLAQEVSLSESQLTRLFRQELGLSPAAYLWRVRTDRVAELLTESDVTVARAATCAGWTNPSAASRAFKRRYGVSPGIFAARIRAAPRSDGGSSDWCFDVERPTSPAADAR
jgi:AraC-like DNA-binding protein